MEVAFYDDFDNSPYSCSDCQDDNLYYTQYDFNQMVYSFGISNPDKVSYNLNFIYGWDKLVFEDSVATLYFQDQVVLEDFQMKFYNYGQFFIEQSIDYSIVTDNELSLYNIDL